jgi:hypothetical protein
MDHELKQVQAMRKFINGAKTRKVPGMSNGLIKETIIVVLNTGTKIIRVGGKLGVLVVSNSIVENKVII